MRSLREFAQFVGKPEQPISPRALVDYLQLNFPSTLSVRELVQLFDQYPQPVALEAISVEPSNHIVPFQVDMQITGAKGYIFGVRWRILRGGQQVAAYEVSKVGAGIPQAVHTFFEPGTYTVEATVKGIGKDGYAEAKKSFTVVAKPKSAPPPPPPSISVDYDGPAAEAEFTVTGNGFVPNHAVHIRVVNNSNLVTVFFDTTSASNGAIDHQLNFPCVPGIKLSFSANDERDDPNDVTGTLWSNTVTLTVT
jgi:hypothetical protein